MTRRRRILLWSLVGFILLLGALAATGYLWLRTSLPQTEGEIALTGIGAPVSIGRDAHGIVTIRAANDEDAYFALGFAHAQDRLFQMEFTRRLGSGRLSEVLGTATLETDRFMRTMGFRRLAEAQLPLLSPGLRDALDAYTNGVNAYLESHDGAWPPEFHALFLEPEPWQPADSLIWGRLMALQLSDNWRSEYLRAGLAAILSAEQLEYLWPAMERDQASLPAGHEIERAAIEPVPALPFGMEMLSGASNAWAVAPARSASGGALLAGDPHLGLQLPIQWYLVRIETPDRTMEGVTAPGVPLIVIGHNDHVAWSFTTTHGDNQDLFLETIDPADPAQYLTPEGPQPFEIRDEIIRTRGDDVALVVRSTRHGPVLSDIGIAEELADDDTAVALAWACLEADDHTPEALFRMNRATDARAFRAALDLFHCPLQNIVYADSAGTIGFATAGRMPVRAALSAGSQMPADGASGEFDWLGYLDAADLPQYVDPARGWIATANNRIVDDVYPHFIAARWDASYRVDRIDQVLAENIRFTIDDMSILQQDTLSLASRALLPVMLDRLGATGESDTEIAAFDLLKAWDGRVDRDLAAPLVFHAWTAAAQHAVFGDDLGPLYEDYAWWNVPLMLRLLDGSEASEAWCDDIATEATETCADAFSAAWRSSIATLADAYGDDPSRWQWGDAHQVRFAHPVWARVPLVGGWLTTWIATPGDQYTINRGTAAVLGNDGRFPHLQGAGLRFAIDLADPAGARFMIAGGQSGNIFSPHYADLIGLWRDGSFLSIVADPDSVLTLTPALHD
ncbi:MAG: penicillin acylase family protein [Dongiaceae bacterium]